MREHINPLDFPVKQGRHFPLKYRGKFSLKKDFHDRWMNKRFKPNLWEVAVLSRRLKIRSCQG